MIVTKIQISNFRNFKRKVFKFSPKTTVIVGPNASGKTNILECLFLLSTGKSFRARVEEEMISYPEEIARVKGEFLRPKTSLEVVLTRGEITVGEDPEKTERVPRKRLLINGLAKRLIDFAGNFRVVVFGPQDLELVIESPSRRRNFLDTVLSQVDREYRRGLLSYEKGLRQRNRLLFRIRENLPAGRQGASRSQLLFWDKLLIKNGDYISQKREEFIDFINTTSPMNEQYFSLDYDKSAISEARLEQYAKEEVAAATTLVGPHRDDFCFRLKKGKRARDLSRYGSRGEQRMSVLWLKLAELAYIEEKSEEKPTLLLDDIFSELDHEHRKVVMKAVGGQQTIITTADPHFIEDIEKVEKIKL
ncbi:DNA replication and repair protein RecF [Patescibacteria group bacterium]|nr:DNA replication and repair protein RecF [Patescibacteria group bacterium]